MAARGPTSYVQLLNKKYQGLVSTRESLIREVVRQVAEAQRKICAFDEHWQKNAENYQKVDNKLTDLAQDLTSITSELQSKGDSPEDAIENPGRSARVDSVGQKLLTGYGLEECQLLIEDNMSVMSDEDLEDIESGKNMFSKVEALESSLSEMNGRQDMFGKELQDRYNIILAKLERIEGKLTRDEYKELSLVSMVRELKKKCEAITGPLDNMLTEKDAQKLKAEEYIEDVKVTIGQTLVGMSRIAADKCRSEDKIQKLKARLEALAGEKEETIHKMERANTTLLETMERARESEKDVKEERKAYENQMKQKEAELQEKLKQQQGEFEQKMRVHTQKYDRLKESLSHGKSTRDSRGYSDSSFMAQMGNMEETLRKMECNHGRDFKELKESNKDVEKHLKYLEDAIRGGSHKSIKAEMQSLSTRCIQLTAILGQILEEVEENKVDMVILLREMEVKLRDTEDRLHGAMSMKEGLEAKLNSARATVKSLRQELEAAKNGLAEYQMAAKVDRVEMAIESLGAQQEMNARGLRESGNSLWRKVEEMTECLLGSDTRRTKSLMREMKQQVEYLIEVLENHIQDAAEQKARDDKSINNFSENLKKTAMDLDTAKNKLLKSQQELEKLRLHTRSTTEELTAATDSLTEARANLENTIKEKEKLELKLKETDDKFIHLEMKYARNQPKQKDGLERLKETLSQASTSKK